MRRTPGYCCCVSALLALQLLVPSAAAPLTVVNSIHDIWGNVAMQAAEVGPQSLRMSTLSAMLTAWAVLMVACLTDDAGDDQSHTAEDRH